MLASVEGDNLLIVIGPVSGDTKLRRLMLNISCGVSNEGMNTPGQPVGPGDAFGERICKPIRSPHERGYLSPIGINNSLEVGKCDMLRHPNKLGAGELKVII